MLLILSEKGDLSTNDVIDWLIHLNVPFIRLNNDESDGVQLLVESSESGISCIVRTSKQTIKLSEITAFWYRRGGIPQFKIPAESIDEAFNKMVSGKIKEYLNLESRILYDFLHDYLDKIPNKIGSREKAGVNKLIVLQKAQELGLKTPNWSVSMKTSDTMDFIDRVGGKVITKGIWESLIASTPTSGYSTYTELISLPELENFPSEHFPSMLQQNVIKKYEVRTFYLLGRIWSMAIFSQNDPQTTIDFRKYNDDKPNRNVPFKLPDEIEQKLTKLMDFLELETGSIDFLVDENDNFIFLEVNPVGQFGMTSSPCNYYLEKEVANHFSLATNSANEKI
jgi:ATP-GRASP peptide maturase of grasp-with-spasm system